MAYNLARIPQNATKQHIVYKGRDYELVSSSDDGFNGVLYRNGRAISMLPPKALAFDAFQKRHPLSECVLEESVIGDEVSLFYHGEWSISTTDGISGEELQDRILGELDSCLRLLDTRKCYVFVVTPTRLFLTYCYEFDDYNVAHASESHGEFKDSPVRSPEHLAASTYEEAVELFASYNCDTSSTGMTIHHIATGERCDVRNPMFELAQLNLKIQYRFFHMRSQERVDEYLREFPEDTNTFDRLTEHVTRFTGQLHQNYVRSYVKKERWDAPIPHRVHLHALHQLYVRTLRPRPVTLGTVARYINGLHPAKLFYTMNPQVATMARDMATDEDFSEANKIDV